MIARLKQLKDRIFWRRPRALVNEEIPNLVRLLRLGKPITVGRPEEFPCPFPDCDKSNQILTDDIAVPFFLSPVALIACVHCRREMFLKIIWGCFGGDHPTTKVEAYVPPGA